MFHCLSLVLITDLLDDSSNAVLHYIMHQSFVTTVPHLEGWAGDSGANVRGIDYFSSPAVPGKCQAWGATNYPTAPKFMYIYHQKGILEGQEWFLQPMASKLCIFYHQVSILDGPWEHHKHHSTPWHHTAPNFMYIYYIY